MSAFWLSESSRPPDLSSPLSLLPPPFSRLYLSSRPPTDPCFSRLLSLLKTSMFYPWGSTKLWALWVWTQLPPELRFISFFFPLERFPGNCGVVFKMSAHPVRSRNKWGPARWFDRTVFYYTQPFCFCNPLPAAASCCIFFSLVCRECLPRVKRSSFLFHSFV